MQAAVLDACVLYPAPLRDFFMRLAVKLYQPKWGDKPSLGLAKFDSLKLDATLSNRVWTITKASLNSKEAEISGRGTLRLPEGTVDKSYGMDLVFESIQPSMELFKPFIGDLRQTGSGAVNVNVQ